MAENKKRIRKKKRHPELDCEIRAQKEAKKKNTKKIIIASIAAAIALACLITAGVVAYKAIQRNRYELDKYEVDFESNTSAFVDVASRVLTLYNNEKAKNENLERLMINVEPAVNWKAICYTADGKSYSADQALLPNDKSAYAAVERAFANTQNKDLMMIRVTEDRIIFSGRFVYSVVYMINGGKPDYVALENENYSSIFSEKITGNWYQVIGAK
jgi:hypothetical protein